MKKIGFIDYYLNEWHADNYPAWIRELSGGECAVACAWGKIDAPGGMTNAQWAEKNHVQLLPTVDDVVEQSDYLVVLSPDNPEMHEELCEKPLASGKRTYVDKTFAADRATALRLMERAEKYRTPMYSSSALRFADEYQSLPKEAIDCISSFGPNGYATYSIHQIEPIVALMGADIRRVMGVGTSATAAVLFQFGDGRIASVHHYAGECPFRLAVNYKTGKSELITVESDYFRNFLRRMIEFFQTGRIQVPHEQTVAVITAIEYGRKALADPGVWHTLP